MENRDNKRHNRYSSRKNKLITRVLGVVGAASVLLGVGNTQEAHAAPESDASSASQSLTVAGTWKGEPGKDWKIADEKPQGKRIKVQTPGSVPIVEDFAGSVQATTHNLERAMDRSSYSIPVEVRGFSAGAIAVHNAQHRAEKTGKHRNVEYKYYGDPCGDNGILRVPGIAEISGVACPPAAKSGNKSKTTHIYDPADPIANGKSFGNNAAAWANGAFAYRGNGHSMAGRKSGTYEVVETQHGSKTNKRIISKRTALGSALNLPKHLDDQFRQLLPQDQQLPKQKSTTKGKHAAPSKPKRAAHRK